MDRNKIKWCIKQNKGIKLIELKPHLSESYINEADETLESALVIKGKWKVITAYDACYNALYAILMNCGIQCEIHDCTLELMELLEFDSSDIAYIKKLKEDRIQTQYYLKNIQLENELQVKKFIAKSKLILNTLNQKKIEEIRTKVKGLIENK